MSVNNVVACAVLKPNTGFGNCVLDWALVKGVIFAPDNYSIPTASVAGAITQLKADILNDVYASRIFPVYGIIPTANNTETLPQVTNPDGSKETVRDVFYDITYKTAFGKFCLQWRLRQLINNVNKSFFLYDANGVIWGTNVGDGNVTAIKPNSSWANVPTPNTGAATTDYTFNLNFYGPLIADYPATIDFRGQSGGGLAFLKNLKGLQDVTITKVARATNVLTVTAITNCGTTNLYDLYPSALAAVNQWAAFADASGAPGNVITITSVTALSNSKSFVITVDTTDPDYVAGAPIWVSMAGPTETYPVLMTGYESQPASIVV